MMGARSICKATYDDRNEILSLYKIQLSSKYCAWDEYYPNIDNIICDLESSSLFVMKENNKIIASISLEGDKECDTLPCWNVFPALEITRVAVLPDYQNQGIAREMLKYGMDILKKRGISGARLLVSANNIKALRSYSKLQFSNVGKCFMYDQEFLCFEKKLD